MGRYDIRIFRFPSVWRADAILNLQPLTRRCRIFPRATLSTSMFIRIKESKTDPFPVGHTITVRANNLFICPVLAMKRYIARRQIVSIGPLFVNASGKPITKHALISETRKFLVQASFNDSTVTELAQLQQPLQQNYRLALSKH